VRLYSYVVRYDSGFAPNPFFGFCTLATCKPNIRKTAQIGNWIVGVGSGNKAVGREGYLVYAMRVTEILPRRKYWEDIRFRKKRPNLRGSRKLACGDNIYRWDNQDARWRQLDSYHSRSDGSENADHLKRDTTVDRVLISSDFLYFGGAGPRLPATFRRNGNKNICKAGPGYKCVEDAAHVGDVVAWIRSLGEAGCLDRPWDWIHGK
jgi:hypothetical protein